MYMETKIRKICILTGTRAEYGLLRFLIAEVRADPDLELQLVVTGMHLSPEFGLTIKEILEEGHPVANKVEMLMSSDTSVGLAKSIGVGIMGFADCFENLKPDLVVLLGDRFEMLAAATAAMANRIPIAHIHGGEATEGLIDEPIRHSITKMSHLHFVATHSYAKRVQQLGENPANVFNVGGLGVDGILKTKLLSKTEVQRRLDFSLRETNLLITFHPITLEKGNSLLHLQQLLSALGEQSQVGLVFTLTNADPEGRQLNEEISKFCDQHRNAACFASLGQHLYLSVMNLVDGVVGNSSSGIIEAPTLGTATVNVGDRQRGRVKAKSVIDCKPSNSAIKKALRKILSEEFQKMTKEIENPYGQGGATSSILKIIKNVNLDGILKKPFFDL